MVKPTLRTKSIGFKVSGEEYAQLDTAAQSYRCCILDTYELLSRSSGLAQAPVPGFAFAHSRRRAKG